MEIQQDFRELLELLNAHEVEFVIVGAYFYFLIYVFAFCILIFTLV